MAEVCSRCGREAPTVTRGPGGMAAEGWVYHEDEHGALIELVCPGCQTDEDIAESWPDFPTERDGWWLRVAPTAPAPSSSAWTAPAARRGTASGTPTERASSA